MRKIMVFTGTRAEYGLLYWLMRDIDQDADLSLQLVVTGSHLSPEFGMTYKLIEADGFTITAKVEALMSSNTPVGVLKSVGLSVISFAETFTRLSPDVIVILGDRFEALAAAQTSLILKIPVLHIHGGEITEGAYDDAIRHSITKMSAYHCTTTEVYRRRVIQMGESPDRVFNVGAVGLDHLTRSTLMSREELSDSIGFELVKPFFLVTFHSETLSTESSEKDFQSLLSVLDDFKDFQMIITYPNADEGGRNLITVLEKFKEDRSDRVYTTQSLGQIRYLSAMKHCRLVIGNSSSGIIECPSFNVQTINIGNRQKGRLAAQSVINCAADSSSIRAAITDSLIEKRDDDSDYYANPYGQGNASGQIVELLKSMNLTCIKTFFDINVKMENLG